MADYRLRMDDTLSIDTDYNGGGPDVGITYAIAAGFEDLATVTASTGTLVPLQPGLVVVEVKDSVTSLVLRRIMVELVSTAQASFEADVAAEEASLAVTFTSTNGSLPLA